MVSTSISGFIAKKLAENRKFIKIVVNLFNVIVWLHREKTGFRQSLGHPTSSSEARG